MNTLLRVGNLRVDFSSRAGPVSAIQGVTLEIARGEMVGLVGESGCGKTTLALSLLCLLPENACVSGSVCYRSRELLTLDEEHLEKIRGAEISMISQEPALALHPTLRIRDQVSAIIHAHSDLSWRRCRQESYQVLSRVGFRQVRRIADSYPHELSGGERQRVAIAQAVASEPSLLIADEPTTSVDSIVQANIRAFLQDLNQRLGIAMLLISHNPILLASTVDRLLVMSSGRIVEEGRVQRVLENPVHGYTRTLVQCLPRGLASANHKQGPVPHDCSRIPVGQRQ